MNPPYRFSRPPLDARTAAAVFRVARSLDRVPLGGQASDVFGALRGVLPVAGGTVGTMSASLGAMITHVVGLPKDVLEGWATTPRAHLALMMAPLVPAEPGTLIPDRSAITGAFREELELLGVIRSAGLGESAGFKVAVRGAPFRAPEHRFLTFALEDSALFDRAHHDALAHLLPNLQAALVRIGLPIVAEYPLFAQILEERRSGFVCFSEGGSVVELNERAHELTLAYAVPARVEMGRGFLERFVRRIVEETAGGDTWMLGRPDGAAYLEISTHHVAKELHAVERGVTLALLHEVEIPLPDAPIAQALPALPHAAPRAAAPPAPEVDLTPRQNEVARLLGTTDLSYKEIGARLGIAVGTVRKHVERVYRAYGVQSRIMLAGKVR